ncbi:MAG: TolC family outer membrane protein [Rubellimicrobium sp.]|nr:TolC family outer membrane protein [Rubellimicrobium sp.]
MLAATLVVAPVLPSQAETLADALAFGYENSGLLEQNRALLRAADEDVAQAVARLMPVINWAAQAQLTYPGSPIANISIGESQLSANVSLSANLTLFDGGQTQFAIEAQKETVLGTRQALLGVEQQVMLRIVQAYMDVRRANEFVALRQNNVRLITQELRAAQDRFEVGEVTRTDVALAEARLAAARSQLAAEEGFLLRAVEEFRAAVGRAPGSLQPAPAARIGQSVTEAKAIAQRTHPSILQAQHAVTAAELGIRRAEAAMGPTVSLTGQVGLNENLDAGAQIGVQVGGPIYQGGALSSQLRQFMARRDATRASLLVTAQAVDQNVGNAYALLQVARASIEASERQVRAATVAFEGVREEATLGARTTLDVLNAEQELLNARASLISAQVDETIASYTVLASMGLLTAQTLNLRVQLYDPSAYYNLVDGAPPILSEQGAALDRVLRAIGGN